MIRKSLLLLLSAAAALLVCLFLSSPVQDSAQILAVNRQGGAVCTVWGASGAAAMLAVCVYAVISARKEKDLFAAVLCIAAGSALVFSRLCYCLANPDRYMTGYSLKEAIRGIINVKEGGFLFSGAALGAALACLLISTVSRKYTFSQLAEKLLCPFLFVSAMLFAAESHTSAGRGPAAGSTEALFPFTVAGRFGKARYAVFMYESAVQFLMLALSVILHRREKRALLPVLLFTAALRVPLITLNTGDVCTLGFLPFRGSGFVKTECAAAGAVLLICAVRAATADKRKTAWLRPVLCAALITCGILCIRAMDKTAISDTLLYLLLTASVVLSALCTLVPSPKKKI